MEPKSDRVIDVINWGREVFLNQRIPHARYNIEVLVEHITGKSRADIYCDCRHRLSPREMSLIREYVERRLRHCPLWHLVGSADFFGFTIEVNDRVLIPRPETEILVEVALQELEKRRCDSRLRYVADIGTGSGNAAIALAGSLSDIFVYATDISEEALEVAAVNARNNRVDGAISFCAGDLFAPLCGGAHVLDMIVSNPPYVSAAEWNELPEEVREREPVLALYGGEDGFSVIRRLVDEAPEYLRHGGALIMEVGNRQAWRVAEMLAASGEYLKSEIHRDFAGIERVIKAVRK